MASRRNPAFVIGGIVLSIMFAAFVWAFCTETVGAGQAAAASMFGNVSETVYTEGLHFVNPMLDFTHYDCRQRTYPVENIGVPSQDKLVTVMDVSIQYRLNASMVAGMLGDTGNEDTVIQTHLVPQVRSILRSQGKGIVEAESFFLEDTQATLETDVQAALAAFCEPKGIIVERVLFRDIVLPP
jgi:regulator of protease activity HflC (stomatin/prohibitin superfamily)